MYGIIGCYASRLLYFLSSVCWVPDFKWLGNLNAFYLFLSSIIWRVGLNYGIESSLVTCRPGIASDYIIFLNLHARFNAKWLPETGGCDFLFVCWTLKTDCETCYGLSRYRIQDQLHANRLIIDNNQNEHAGLFLWVGSLFLSTDAVLKYPLKIKTF